MTIDKNRVTGGVVAAATCAALATAETLPDTEQRWLLALQAVVRALIHRLAASRDLSEPELPYVRVQAAEDALDAIGPLTGWTPLDIGDVHQELLRLELTQDHGELAVCRPKGASTRDSQGSWYTPTPLARETTRLALEATISILGPEPDEILRMRAVDPACGAGVIMVEGARLIAGLYAARLAGTPEPPPLLVRKLLPEVIYTCVYGMDIDPVAVDLARTSLWLEVGGRPGFGWLDGNVACLDPLAGPMEVPERLLAVMGAPPDLADVLREPVPSGVGVGVAA